MKELSREVINQIVYSEYSPKLADLYESFKLVLTTPEMIRLGNYIANDLLRELKYHKIPIDYFEGVPDVLAIVLIFYARGDIDKISATDRIREILIEGDCL